jgi:hypothetical protein
MNTFILVIVAAVLLVMIALSLKPLRKAMGLLTIVLGVFACMSGIGAIIGVPMILVGGILLFI